jgi:hypothetical protein
MADGKIVIKKWKIFLRKIVAGSQSSAARFRNWLQQLFGRWREDKYRTLSINSGLKKRELPTGTRDPIRIARSPLQGGSERSTRSRAPGRSTPGDGRSSRTPGGITVTPGAQICLACTYEILPSEARAKCGREHVIHERCVSLVKNKCPTCKGYISKRANRIQINSENGKICPACTLEIAANEATAKCRTNRDHIIHRRCTTLVKNQCPTCKGFIA